MSRDLARILRWRHARFARFRARHWYLTLRQPFRNWWYLATHPDDRRIIRAVRRAVAQGQMIIAA